MSLKTSEHVEGARNDLYDVALTRKIPGEHSLPAQPFRASSHALPAFFSIARNKIPLAEQGTSGNLPSQQKAVGMPEIKVVTEVAGRVCALPIEAGADVSDGDDLAFVEAMKMEIPVASPAAGVLKLLLVAIDDVVREGQVVAVIET